MSAPTTTNATTHAPLSSQGHPADEPLTLQMLHQVVYELKDLIESRADTEAQVAARYEARIAELVEENEKLTKDCNEALCIRQALEALQEQASGGNSNTTPKLDASESPDVSPVLEQRILNLQMSLERVRRRARRKEEEVKKRIQRLEWLAWCNIETACREISMNVMKPVKDEWEVKEGDEGW